jgi:DNA-binding CsgD family transcriptional regulator
MRFLRRAPDELTQRQREVLALLRRGLTNEEIGRELGISTDGAKFHVSQILSKLQLSSRHEAASLPPEVGARRPWWAALAPLPLLREMKWSTAASVAGAAVTAGGIVAIVVLAWGVAVTGSGSSVVVERDGDACAPTVREEFLRQQALVEWDVYCPSKLPDGFRLATAEDAPPEPPHLGADARPTIDMMDEGPMTFITRLVRSDGAEIVVAQGVGLSSFDQGFGAPRTAAMFGNLSAALYGDDQPTVVAWADDLGRMVSVHRLGPNALDEIAAEMRTVRLREPQLRDALLSVLELSDGYPPQGSSWLPAGDTLHPIPDQACLELLALPSPAAVASFTDLGSATVREMVIQFHRPEEADAYMGQVRIVGEQCAPESDQLSITTRALPYAAIGDDVVGFRLTTSAEFAPAQRAVTDVVAVSVDELVTLLLWFQFSALDDPPPGDLHLQRLLEAAAERLQAFAEAYEEGAGT